METISTGSNQSAFVAYCNLIGQTVVKANRGKPGQRWPTSFETAQTDFERVTFFLKLLIENTAEIGAGIKFCIPNLPSIGGDDDGGRKNDQRAVSQRVAGNKSWQTRNCEQALHNYTNALFLAKSDLQQALALGNRSCVLCHLGCYREAAEDIERSFELKCPTETSPRLHIRAGQCYQNQRNLTMAKEHFERALKLLEVHESAQSKVLQTLACDGLTACAALQVSACKLAWYCERTPAKELCSVNLEHMEDKETIVVSSFVTQKSSISLRNGGPKRGWFLEAARDISPGEVIIVDSPYSSRLRKDCYLTHCYRCYRRCVNLTPCSACCQVGFCSNKCKEEAMQPPWMQTMESSVKGLGHHVFDCGFLSYLLLDNYAGWPKASGDNDSVGGHCGSHLGSACIMDTEPASLLHSICRSSVGHQAFVGDKARESAPPIIDPHDYTSIAWLSSNSSLRSVQDLWQRTVAALFLTHILHVAGYPMNWSLADLFTQPSADFQGSEIPASWIAACILLNLQTSPTNAHGYSETTLFMKRPGQRPAGFDLSNAPLRTLASCFYSCLSLLNHACDPNVYRLYAADARCQLIAMRPIAKGVTLLDCYGAHYGYEGLAERQKDQSIQYHFTCNCIACSENWPGGLELMKQPPSSVFLFCPRCSCKVPVVGDTMACKCPPTAIKTVRSRYLRLKSDLMRRFFEMEEKFANIDIEDMSKNLVSPTFKCLCTLLGSGKNGFSGLLCRPASSWDIAQELFKMMLVFYAGNWSVEPSV